MPLRPRVRLLSLLTATASGRLRLGDPPSRDYSVALAVHLEVYLELRVYLGLGGSASMTAPSSEYGLVDSESKTKGPFKLRSAGSTTVVPVHKPTNTQAIIVPVVVRWAHRHPTRIHPETGSVSVLALPVVSTSD